MIFHSVFFCKSILRIFSSFFNNFLSKVCRNQKQLSYHTSFIETQTTNSLTTNTLIFLNQGSKNGNDDEDEEKDDESWNPTEIVLENEFPLLSLAWFELEEVRCVSSWWNIEDEWSFASGRNRGSDWRSKINKKCNVNFFP